MDKHSVSGPYTIFDWAVMREEFREKLDVLPLESLATMYGLSCTEGFRDDEFVQLVESYLQKVKDPVRTRYELAYALGSVFWDAYEIWQLNHGQLGIPGYVGGLLDALHDRMMEWLLDGLSAYSDEDEVMDYAFYLISRAGMGDTVLEEGDQIRMEAAANKEISFKTSPGGRRIVRLMNDTFKKQSGNQETGQSE